MPDSSFEKLNKTNYNYWYYVMATLLVEMDLWDVVDVEVKSKVITILGANSNSDKNIAGIIHAKVILTHTRKGKLNTP